MSGGKDLEVTKQIRGNRRNWDPGRCFGDWLLRGSPGSQLIGYGLGMESDDLIFARDRERLSLSISLISRTLSFQSLLSIEFNVGGFHE